MLKANHSITIMFYTRVFTSINRHLSCLFLCCLSRLISATSLPLDEHLVFSPAEIAIIERFGPWPPLTQQDKTNRLDDLPLAQRLGKSLFFDPGLSANNQVSCASCHQPNKAFSDQIAIAQGIHLGHRNTPTLWNIKFKRWYGWGGDIDTLWGASLRALLNPTEMAASAASIKHYLSNQTYLQSQLQQLLPWKNAKTDQDKLVVVGKLLAAYQGSLISQKSEFDLFRESLMAQNDAESDHYSDAKKRGLKLFIGKGNCQVCHNGPLFSNNEFADIGIRYFDRQGKVDKGRYQGIQSLKASPFSSLGEYNDDTGLTSRIQAQHLVLKHRNFGEFMVPSLRNIASTSPYMHQGSLLTLDDVIEHYSNLDEERLHTDGVAILRPLNLTQAEKADLKAFLESL